MSDDELQDEELDKISGGRMSLPEKDDEVLVAFEHGSPRKPVIIGGLWNGSDRPPESD
jgi:uncharacterized protein involved in type VI secretion and phage assembly